ncbi:Mpv17/PMP22 [Corchorus capsularis]|uniref:Mpv17/PMP22 n=1 Tax=Corchorus capsularis TaxID=210143 RepID=A0A1R3IMQ9_COCAP|nr:Mpv17/PMP22 [Corchorus capsularis]
MEALGGNGAFWGWNIPEIRSKKKSFSSNSKSSDSTAEVTAGGGYRFPLKQAVTAASLALTGDTIAQLSDRWRKQNQSLSSSADTNKTPQNLMLKVLLNQIVLGPCVIAVVFAWNNLWLGKLSELPNKYQKDALPTLFYGFRFWIPVSVLNFCLQLLDYGSLAY